MVRGMILQTLQKSVACIEEVQLCLSRLAIELLDSGVSVRMLNNLFKLTQKEARIDIFPHIIFSSLKDREDWKQMYDSSVFSNRAVRDVLFAIRY